MHRQVVFLFHSWGVLINYLPLLDLQEIDVRVPYAPEIKVELTTPALHHWHWWYYATGAQYSGLLFAGRFEFNWIVDIRLDNEDQEVWSNGNLITSKLILTTCRASMILQRKSKTIDNIRVYFGTQYLWEKHLQKSRVRDNYDDEGVTGVRSVEDIKLHPKCTPKSFQWDTSIIQLRNDILPLSPGLGYTPIALDLATGKVILDEKRGALCYVASYGRRTRTAHHNAHFMDFKTKHRVYPVNWTVCQGAQEFMCDYRKDDFCANKLLLSNHLCYEIRARVGAVCDHTRGAPIVCDDQLSGMVIRGADFEHCNPVLHIPFIALTLRDFYDYFERTVDNYKPQSQATSLKKYWTMYLNVVGLVLSSVLVCSH